MRRMSRRKNKDKIISTDASAYERIGKRLKVRNTKEHVKVILDDAFENVRTTLDKDGSTGKLGSPDGILRGKEQMIGGFFVQCFGQMTYQSEVDVLGKLIWFGFAKKSTKRGDRTTNITFSTQEAQPQGYDTEHECGNYLTKLIELYNNQKVN